MVILQLDKIDFPRNIRILGCSSLRDGMLYYPVVYKSQKAYDSIMIQTPFVFVRKGAVFYESVYSVYWNFHEKQHRELVGGVRALEKYLHTSFPLPRTPRTKLVACLKVGNKYNKEGFLSWRTPVHTDCKVYNEKRESIHMQDVANMVQVQARGILECVGIWVDKVQKRAGVHWRVVQYQCICPPRLETFLFDDDSAENVPAVAPEPVAEKREDEPVLPEKYARILRMGVPLEAVRQRMLMETGKPDESMVVGQRPPPVGLAGLLNARSALKGVNHEEVAREREKATRIHKVKSMGGNGIHITLDSLVSAMKSLRKTMQV